MVWKCSKSIANHQCCARYPSRVDVCEEGGDVLEGEGGEGHFIGELFVVDGGIVSLVCWDDADELVDVEIDVASYKPIIAESEVRRASCL